jgi:hypothetical protein
MKGWIALLVLMLAAPAAGQDGPIARSIATQYAAPTTTIYTTEMRSPVLFWSGAALVAGGTTAVVAALTWAQESDLSLENPNTRLGRDLAPCGTDPSRSRLPIADCKTNTGLQVFGILVSAGGGVLMAYGGQRVQIAQIGPRAFAARIRF